MNGYDPTEDRGMPPADYETAEADAIAEAMPMIRWLAEGKKVLNPPLYTLVEEIVFEDFNDLAVNHAARVDDHPDTIDDIYDALVKYELKDTDK